MGAKQNKSAAAFERACKVLVGGVDSPVRAFRAVGGSPPVIASAEGSHITDLDGREYVDYVGSYGPMILGHAQQQVVTAITKAARHGTSFGAPTDAETRLAELVVSAIPSVEMVRFVNSGTEACMSAIRLARGATGRDRVIKCAGCYHGHADAMLVQAGSGATTLGVPSSPGVPAGTTADTTVVPFNDLAAVSEVLERHPGQVAAMIVEPVVGNMGVVQPRPGYLAGLKELCRRHGTLLILDEVMTGFRLAFGGAQEVYDVRADITTLGKVIGGGLPVGAYGASVELMSHIAPLGRVYQAGTLSGNPLAMAAGLATLEALRDGAAYGRLEALGGLLQEALAAGAEEAGIRDRITISRAGSMVTVFFTRGPVVDYASATTSNVEAFAAFFQTMLAEGVYLPPSQFEAWFVSLAHTEEDISATAAAAAKAFAAAAKVL